MDTDHSRIDVFASNRARIRTPPAFELPRLGLNSSQRRHETRARQVEKAVRVHGRRRGRDRHPGDRRDARDPCARGETFEPLRFVEHTQYLRDSLRTRWVRLKPLSRAPPGGSFLRGRIAVPRRTMSRASANSTAKLASLSLRDSRRVRGTEAIEQWLLDRILREQWNPQSRAQLASERRLARRRQARDDDDPRSLIFGQHV